MARLFLLSVLLAGTTVPAMAQTTAFPGAIDPLAAQRFDMEQIRARTELQGLNASLHAAQTEAARQQLRDVVRNDPVGAARPEPVYVPASSPRCDPRTTSPANPCVVKPRRPAAR